MTDREMAAMVSGMIIIAVAWALSKTGDTVSATLVPLSLFIMIVALFYAYKRGR